MAQKPRESSAQTAARKRHEAEERNRRYRRTRDLRAALERIEGELRRADAELAELVERLAEPSVYADGDRVRELIARHDATHERRSALAPERDRIRDELDAAEAVEAPVGGAR